MLWSGESQAGPQDSGLGDPEDSHGTPVKWPRRALVHCLPAPAHGPAAPRQEGVGGGAAAKEKWVWGGGCGCGCGYVVRGRRSLGRQGPPMGQRGGGKVSGLGPDPHPHRHWCSRVSPSGLQSPHLTLMPHTRGGLWEPGGAWARSGVMYMSHLCLLWQPEGEGHRYALLHVGTGSPEGEAEALLGHGCLLGVSFVPARARC